MQNRYYNRYDVDSNKFDRTMTLEKSFFKLEELKKELKNEEKIKKEGQNDR